MPCHDDLVPKTHWPHLTAALLAAGLLGACNDGGAGRATTPLPDGDLACALPLPPLTPPPTKVETACATRDDARIQAMSDAGIGLMSALGLPPGRYALPDDPAPTQLVVMFHGHGNESCAWREHMREVAAAGAVAVAMDYSGQEDRETEAFGFVANYGWAVRSGAADSILAAQYFMDRYPSITQLINIGASMGSNAAGPAAYGPDAVRADCSPLWDYWVQAEGVHNLTQEYLGIRSLAPTLPAAALAQQEIEEENGGTLEEVPDRYAEITNVLHADGLSTLKGAVLTHGTNDQTVPVDQSRQMTDALRAFGVPTHLYLVVGSDHVWEGNGEAAVMRQALDEVLRLLDGGVVSDGESQIPGP